jgi:hypothetical protein
LAALGFAALLAVACSKQGAPTKAEYNGVADQVCAAAHDELEKALAEHQKTKPDGGANQRFVRATVIPRLRTMTAQLRGIQPPETDGAYLGSIYADYDHALAILYTDPLGTSADTATRAAEARMRSYGMAGCAKAGELQTDD